MRLNIVDTDIRIGSNLTFVGQTHEWPRYNRVHRLLLLILWDAVDKPQLYDLQLLNYGNDRKNSNSPPPPVPLPQKSFNEPQHDSYFHIWWYKNSQQRALIVLKRYYDASLYHGYLPSSSAGTEDRTTTILIITLAIIIVSNSNCCLVVIILYEKNGKILANYFR